MTYTPANERLSNSRSYSFNKCRKLYDYRYRQGMQVKPRDMWLDSWTRMHRGVLIHAGFEAGFQQLDILSGVTAAADEEKAKGMSDEQLLLHPNLITESTQVAKDAMAWLPASDWEPVRYNDEPMVEAELTAELPGWQSFLGYADLVARHKPTGRVLLIDYKTRMRFEGDDEDKWNAQFAAYSYCLGRMGVVVDGSLLFEIKPVLPKRPPRFERIDSGSLDGVRLSNDGRFRTTTTFRSQTFLRNYWEDFSRQAKVIANVKDEEIYRNMSSFTCKDCSYERLCMGELSGHDTEFIEANRYTKRSQALATLEE